MPSFSSLIIGLGNPGKDYEHTRHNIGFMVADDIAEHYKCGPWKKKFRGLVTDAPRFLLLKPQTFMNLSGESAGEAKNFYQLSPSQIIVFHDDIDLQAGQVKIKQGGGAGGHNGLKSLDTYIGQDYWRVRMGVGRPVDAENQMIKGDAVTDYVLNPFTKSDQKWLGPLRQDLVNNLDLLLEGKIETYSAHLPKFPA